MYEGCRCTELDPCRSRKGGKCRFEEMEDWWHRSFHGYYPDALGGKQLRLCLPRAMISSVEINSIVISADQVM